MEAHTLLKLVQRVMYHMNEMQNLPPPTTIVVFTLEPSDIKHITTSVLAALPEEYTSTVRIHQIDDSERVLKGINNSGLSTYRVVYNDDVFRCVTPEQFLQLEYKWFERQVKWMYDKEFDLRELVPESFTLDDAIQECYFYLDRILCKYTSQCNLRTFIANRLRKYFSKIVDRELKKKRDSLLARLERLERLERGN